MVKICKKYLEKLASQFSFQLDENNPIESIKDNWRYINWGWLSWDNDKNYDLLLDILKLEHLVKCPICCNMVKIFYLGDLPENLTLKKSGDFVLVTELNLLGFCGKCYSDYSPIYNPTTNYDISYAF